MGGSDVKRLPRYRSQAYLIPVKRLDLKLAATEKISLRRNTKIKFKPLNTSKPAKAGESAYGLFILFIHMQRGKKGCSTIAAIRLAPAERHCPSGTFPAALPLSRAAAQH